MGWQVCGCEGDGVEAAPYTYCVGGHHSWDLVPHVWEDEGAFCYTEEGGELWIDGGLFG